jgi:hypothetical protein
MSPNRWKLPSDHHQYKSARGLSHRLDEHRLYNPNKQNNRPDQSVSYNHPK